MYCRNDAIFFGKKKCVRDISDDKKISCNDVVVFDETKLPHLYDSIVAERLKEGKQPIARAFQGPIVHSCRGHLLRLPSARRGVVQKNLSNG